MCCTHAALPVKPDAAVRQLYQRNTTREMTELLRQFPFGEQVWQSVAESVCENCMRRTHGRVQVGLILLDDSDRILAESSRAAQIRKEWLACSMN